MYGYIPPWRPSPLHRWGPQGPDEERGPERFMVDDIVCEIVDCPRGISSAIGAACDLLHAHGARINDPGWLGVTCEELEIWHHVQLRVAGSHWPTSLASLGESLGQYDPDGVADRAGPGGGDPRDTPDPSTWAIRPRTRISTFSIPATRWHIRRALQGMRLVAVGFAVSESYDDLEVVTSGRVRVPVPGERLLDGACLVLTGWDDRREVFTCRNHRGRAWGRNGHGSIPYDYLVNAHWTHELIVIG